MMGLGTPELIIIFVVALIFFGPRKLPELGRSLGKALGGASGRCMALVSWGASVLAGGGAWRGAWTCAIGVIWGRFEIFTRAPWL